MNLPAWAIMAIQGFLAFMSSIVQAWSGQPVPPMPGPNPPKADQPPDHLSAMIWHGQMFLQKSGHNPSPITGPAQSAAGSPQGSLSTAPASGPAGADMTQKLNVGVSGAGPHPQPAIDPNAPENLPREDKV